jgi:hypothetical protein
MNQTEQNAEYETRKVKSCCFSFCLLLIFSQSFSFSLFLSCCLLCLSRFSQVALTGKYESYVSQNPQLTELVHDFVTSWFVSVFLSPAMVKLLSFCVFVPLSLFGP